MSAILKRYFFLFLLCCCLIQGLAQEKDFPVIIKDNKEFYQYSPETGEGIYSVSRRFGVPLTELLKYNPSLENGLRKGDTVLVPVIKTADNQYHIITPKETIYSVSKQYNITPEQLIAANPGISPESFPIGREIVIPVKKEIKQDQPQLPKTTEQAYIAPKEEQPHKDELFFEEKDELVIDEPQEEAVGATPETPNNNEIKIKPGEKKDSYSIVLMLPFSGKGDPASGKRYVEYYEGFLLAADSMKAKGLSLNLYVYDTGLSGKAVSAHLNNPVMADADLIIGGVDQKEIKELSGFSKHQGVKYIIPFSSRQNADLENPNIFQINLPLNIAQTKAAHIYAALFKDKNIVFVTWPNDNEKQEFIHLLKSDLQKAAIPFAEINYSDRFLEEVKRHLAGNRKNIIIPTSASAEALQGITPGLRIISTTQTNTDISLYGYPEWQVHAKDILENLFTLDTHFFTTFYTNNTSPEITNFYNQYKHWYHKSLLALYPKYGILGFDTGLYFMNALHKFGTGFDLELEKCTIPLLQSSFDFQRVQENNLFLNMNLFIVRFTPDFTVKKSLAQ